MKELTRKITDSIRSSAIVKMFVIAVLILLFLIPLGMINAVIREREAGWSAIPPISMTGAQLVQSRFSIIRVIGLPRVLPPRNPDTISTLSFSIFIRPPRP